MRTSDLGTSVLEMLQSLDKVILPINSNQTFETKPVKTGETVVGTLSDVEHRLYCLMMMLADEANSLASNINSGKELESRRSEWSQLVDAFQTVERLFWAEVRTRLGVYDKDISLRDDLQIVERSPKKAPVLDCGCGQGEGCVLNLGLRTIKFDVIALGEDGRGGILISDPTRGGIFRRRDFRIDL